MKMKQLDEKTEETANILGMTEVGYAFRETSAGRIEYRLFRQNSESESFWLGIKRGDSCEGGFLTGSLSEVALLFEKTVCGEVPPYILSEILEDYSKEKALLLAKK